MGASSRRRAQPSLGSAGPYRAESTNVKRASDEASPAEKYQTMVSPRLVHAPLVTVDARNAGPAAAQVWNLGGAAGLAIRSFPATPPQAEPPDALGQRGGLRGRARA